MINYSIVEIFSSKMGVSGRSEDFENSILDREERDIKSTTSEIVHDDLTLGSRLVQSIGDGGGGGLVDDSENIEAGDGASVFGSLSLSVVEAVTEWTERTQRGSQADKR
jgi:hypothetical protein